MVLSREKFVAISLETIVGGGRAAGYKMIQIPCFLKGLDALLGDEQRCAPVIGLGYSWRWAQA